MNSGSCNGQSKDASDCSGGTLNISHRARQGKRVKERAREVGKSAVCMVLYFHLMDLLGQQQENNYLHTERTSEHTHYKMLQ